MKRLLFLLPWLLGILACGTQRLLPTQDVSNIVNATLTAIAQNNLQGSALPPTFTPVPIQELPTTSSGLHYYWPTNLPEGYVLKASNSGASGSGFGVEFINPSVGTISIWGGDSVQLAYCAAGSTPQIVRGFDGCFPRSTGGGFSVQWKETDIPYSVGGLGLSKELALQLAEQLESLDSNTWKARLVK